MITLVDIVVDTSPEVCHITSHLSELLFHHGYVLTSRILPLLKVFLPLLEEAWLFIFTCASQGEVSGSCSPKRHLVGKVCAYLCSLASQVFTYLRQLSRQLSAKTRYVDISGYHIPTCIEEAISFLHACLDGASHSVHSLGEGVSYVDFSVPDILSPLLQSRCPFIRSEELTDNRDPLHQVPDAVKYLVHHTAECVSNESEGTGEEVGHTIPCCFPCCLEGAYEVVPGLDDTVKDTACCVPYALAYAVEQLADIVPHSLPVTSECIGEYPEQARQDIQCCAQDRGDGVPCSREYRLKDLAECIPDLSQRVGDRLPVDAKGGKVSCYVIHKLRKGSLQGIPSGYHARPEF